MRPAIVARVCRATGLHNDVNFEFGPKELRSDRSEATDFNRFLATWKIEIM